MNITEQNKRESRALEKILTKAFEENTDDNHSVDVCSVGMGVGRFLLNLYQNSDMDYDQYERIIKCIELTGEAIKRVDEKNGGKACAS